MRDAADTQLGFLLDPVRDGCDVDLFRSRVARWAFPFIHGRGKQLSASFGEHVETRANRLDEWPMGNIATIWRVEGNDRAAARLYADRRYACHSRNFIRPGPSGVYDKRCRVALAFAIKNPFFANPRNAEDSRSANQIAAAFAQVAQMPLKHGVCIKL